jgi:hypothetical protein
VSTDTVDAIRASARDLKTLVEDHEPEAGGAD